MREMVLGALGRGGREAVNLGTKRAAEVSLSTESLARCAVTPSGPNTLPTSALVDTPANLCVSGSPSANSSS